MVQPDRLQAHSRPRLTIAALMAAIVAIACAIAALRYASPVVFAVLACGTLVLLLTAVVGACVGRHRAAWLGFAVFGWGFAIAAWAFSIHDAVSNEPNSVRAWPSMVSPYTPLADLFMFLYPYVHGAPPPATINGVAVPAARGGAESFRHQSCDRSMPARRSRPFLISDGLVLILATALGIAPARLVAQAVRYEAPIWRQQPILRIVDQVVLHATPLVFFLSLSLFFLSLRPPRPRLRALAQTPGFAACVLILLCSVARIIFYQAHAAADWLANPLDGMLIHYSNCLTHTTLDSGLMITGAWIMQALACRWRLGGSWLNWLGVAVGLFPVAHGWFIYFYWLSRFATQIVT